MIGCRLHIYLVPLAKHDVVGRMDTIVRIAGHTQRTCTVEEQLTLAVKGTFLTAARTVGEGVD